MQIAVEVSREACDSDREYQLVSTFFTAMRGKDLEKMKWAVRQLGYNPLRRFLCM